MADLVAEPQIFRRRKVDRGVDLPRTTIDRPAPSKDKAEEHARDEGISAQADYRRRDLLSFLSSWPRPVFCTIRAAYLGAHGEAHGVFHCSQL